MASTDAPGNFSRSAIRIESDLIAAGDEDKASAVYDAMHGFNMAGDTIRSTVSSMRSGLDQVMKNLDGGFNVYEAHEVQRAAELDIAIAKRSLYISQLVSLLGQSKVKELLAK